MSLDVVYGETRHRSIALELANKLSGVISEGTVYLGYPVLSSADERVYVDALLVSRDHGLVAFQLAEGVPGANGDWAKYIADQDRLYGALDNHLGRHEELRKGRRLAFSIETVSVFASNPGAPPTSSDGGHYCAIDTVAEVVRGLDSLDDDIVRGLHAAIQRVTTIKPAKRRGKVARTDSRGAVLKEIEKGIANLDRWQKRAAIETPDGPQRIRGLAGSGKTVVLALKRRSVQGLSR
jgi:superfamily I DNA and RNA helicase